MKIKISLVLIFFIQIFCYAEFKQIATTYNTKLNYSDIVEIFIEECKKPHFEYTIWYPEVYTKEEEQNYAWAVYTCNNGYTNTDTGRHVAERSVWLYTKNGRIAFKTFEESTRTGEYYTSDSFEIKKNTRANFINDCLKWLQRYNKTWNTSELNAFDTFFEYTDNTNLFNIASQCNLKDFLLFLLKNGYNENQKDLIGLSPLHWAAIKGHKEIAQILIQSFADVNIRGIDNWTPLMYAINWNNNEIIQMLLNAGADVNVYASKKINENDDFLPTPLLLSIGRRNNYYTKLLITSGAKINPNNDSALRLAIKYKNSKDIIESIIDRKKNLLSIVPDDYTDLIISAYKNNLEEIKKIKSQGIDLSSKNIDGITPLMFAAANNSLEVIDFLIDSNVNVNVLSERDKYSALHYATYFNSIEAVDKLLKAGIDQELKNNAGWPAYTYAFATNEQEILKLLLSNDKKYVYNSSVRRNIEIKIDGSSYFYYMTNNYDALKYELKKLGFIEPITGDFIENQYLSDFVKEKMRELNCSYSITLSNGVQILNYYKESETPKIVYLEKN